MAVRLGFIPGQVVQEFYYDDDVDEQVRKSVVEETGKELVDVDYGDVVDGVIIWWRADDAEEEDLADLLVDASANLDDGGGDIWVITPTAGHRDSVPMGDIEDAARTCGLQCTNTASFGSNWTGMRLVMRARKR